MSPKKALPIGLTDGRFDTSSFTKVPAGSGLLPDNDLTEIVELKRGMDWLKRETPSLQTFARVVTGNPSIRVEVGPVSCTDGRDFIYIQPQRVPEGREPGPQHMAHLMHEIAHALESDVFEPRESRRMEDSLKFKAVQNYGQPADHVWNGLEDGRVEERLYRTMPGARKHIITDVTLAVPLIVSSIEKTAKRFALEHLIKTGDKTIAQERARTLKTKIEQGTVDEAGFMGEVRQIEDLLTSTGDSEAAKKIERQTVGDMGLLMVSYLFTAGYETESRQFGPEVDVALDDEEMRQIMQSVRSVPDSKEVLYQHTPAFLKRAKELGFFLDYDDRGMNPYTKMPEIIDWNKLTKDEQDELRRQVKEQAKQRPLEEANAVVVNAPDDLFKNASKDGSGNSQPDKSQPGDTPADELDADSEPGEEQDNDESESDFSGSDSPDDSTESGSDPSASEELGSDGSAWDSPSAGESSDDSSPDASPESTDAGSSGEGSDEPSERQSEASNVAGSDTTPVPVEPSELEKAESSEYESMEGVQEVSEGAQEVSDGEDDSQPEVDPNLTAEEVDRRAQDLHAANEESRLDRVKRFKAEYDSIEDTIRPPHVEYTTKAEAIKQEASNPKAAKVRNAINMEVGEISGAPESKFLFTQTKVEAVGSHKSEALREYSDVLAGELNRLRAVFKQNDKSSFSGRYEIGSHINSASLPGLILGEHLKPFDRRIKPRKQSYAVTLLVDQSGSMNNSKIELAKIALCLQSHLLDSLGIPFEVLGFSTVSAAGYVYQGGSYDDGRYAVRHDVFKSFKEPWNSEQRAKILGIRTNSTNLDGLALSWAWNRLKLRRETTKILMTYSDGQPNPDTDNQIRIMKFVLRQMRTVGAISIGVGIQSHAVEDLYEKAIYCDDIRTLPRLVTKSLEEELRRKR